MLRTEVNQLGQRALCHRRFNETYVVEHGNEVDVSFGADDIIPLKKRSPHVSCNRIP